MFDKYRYNFIIWSCIIKNDSQKQLLFLYHWICIPLLAHWTYLSTCKIWNRKEYEFLRLDYEFLWENYIKNYVASGFQFNIGQKKNNIRIKNIYSIENTIYWIGVRSIKKVRCFKETNNIYYVFFWKKHISLFVFDL